MSPEAALVFSNQMSEIDTALGRQGGGGGYHQYRVRICSDQACKVYYYICMSVITCVCCITSPPVSFAVSGCM